SCAEGGKSCRRRRRISAMRLCSSCSCAVISPFGDGGGGVGECRSRLGRPPGAGGSRRGPLGFFLPWPPVRGRRGARRRRLRRRDGARSVRPPRPLPVG